MHPAAPEESPFRTDAIGVGMKGIIAGGLPPVKKSGTEKSVFLG
jgi:hypothetical protein